MSPSRRRNASRPVRSRSANRVGPTGQREARDARVERAHHPTKLADLGPVERQRDGHRGPAGDVGPVDARDERLGDGCEDGEVAGAPAWDRDVTVTPLIVATGARPRRVGILGRWPRPTRPFVPTSRPCSDATSSASGAMARDTGCSTPTAAPTSTSRTGSPSRPSAITTRRSRPRSTPRSTGSSGRRARSATRSRSSELAARLAADLPGSTRYGVLPQLRVRGDRSGPQARPARHRPARDHRLPAAGSMAGRSAPRASRPRTSTTGRATSHSCRGSTFAPFPAAYPEHAGDEEAASEAAFAVLMSLLETVIAPSQVAAVLIEPVQGEGGYHPAPASFLRTLRRLCDTHGILLIADEVQTGYARTGRMWALRACRHRPRRRVRREGDRERSAAVRGRSSHRELQERWGKGAHGSTYGGNPVACAAGLAVLETIERRGARRERRGTRRASSRWRSKAWPPRTIGSATSAGRG